MNKRDKKKIGRSPIWPPYVRAVYAKRKVVAEKSPIRYEKDGLYYRESLGHPAIIHLAKYRT